VHDDREPAAGRVVVDVGVVGGSIIIGDLVRLNVIGTSDDMG
jgi:hypothetical protein